MKFLFFLFLFSTIPYALFIIAKPWVAALLLILFSVLDFLAIYRGDFGMIRLYQVFNALALLSLSLRILLKKSTVRLKFRRRVYFFLLLWFASHILSFFMTIDSRDTLRQIIIYLSLISLSLTIAEMIRFRSISRELIWAVLIAGTLAGIVGLIQVAQYFILKQIRIVSGVVIEAYFRPWGTFAEAGWYGIYMLWVLCMGLPLIQSKQTGIWPKRILAFVVSIATLGIAFSGNRAIYLALGLLIIVAYLYRIPRLRYMIIFAPMASILIVFSVAVGQKDISFYSESIGRVIEIFSGSTTLTKWSNLGKITDAKIALESFLKHPILGNGSGTWIKNYLSKTGFYGGFVTHDLKVRTMGGCAFSSVLTIIYETGISGMIPFIAFWILIGKKLHNILRKMPSNPYAQGMVLSFVVFFIMLFLTPVLGIGFFWIFVGICIHFILSFERKEGLVAKKAFVPIS